VYEAKYGWVDSKGGRPSKNLPSDSKFSQPKLAQELNFSQHKLSQDLQLAQAVKEIPYIRILDSLLT